MQLHFYKGGAEQCVQVCVGGEGSRGWVEEEGKGGRVLSSKEPLRNPEHS